MPYKNKLDEIHYEMMQKCYNPKRNSYKNNGGKGIKVCDEWHDRKNFVVWAKAHNFKKGMRLKRRNKLEDFSPNNCYFSEIDYTQSKEYREKRKEMYSELYEIAGIKNIKSHRLYAIYTHMIGRCYKSDRDNYKYYGAKGISVCDEWKQLHGAYYFIGWALKNGYKEGLTLDRIDVNGNYEPSNCRWVDMKSQCNNKGNNRIIRLFKRTQY